MPIFRNRKPLPEYSDSKDSVTANATSPVPDQFDDPPKRNNTTADHNQAGYAAPHGGGGVKGDQADAISLFNKIK